MIFGLLMPWLRLRLHDMWSLVVVESKLCHCVMVEADSHLKLNSHIHIKYIQSVWAHWYAVHWHTMVSALQSYTTNWPTFGGSGWLVESKWWHYVMVEADSHLNFASRIHIRHIQSVWAHWYAVHKHKHTATYFYSYTHCTWLTSLRFWGSGSAAPIASV